MDMLGFDYFKLLDLLTIARSRKTHREILRHRGDRQFPERLKPINIKPDVDLRRRVSAPSARSTTRSAA